MWCRILISCPVLSSLVLQAALCCSVDALLLKTDPSVLLRKIMAQDARLQGLLILMPQVGWKFLITTFLSCCRKYVIKERQNATFIFFMFTWKCKFQLIKCQFQLVWHHLKKIIYSKFKLLKSISFSNLFFSSPSSFKRRKERRVWKYHEKPT